MDKLFFIAILMLISGCSKSTEQIIENIEGQKIECSSETIITGSIGFLRDSYFSYKNDNASSLDDGEYIISIESKYKNGNYEKTKVAGVPYIKKDGTFSPKIPGFWDQVALNEGDVKGLRDANGQFICSIKDIVKES